jgi:hypothetical protein
VVQNDISFRISQTNIMAFTLPMFVDAFLLHMLLDLHIALILLCILYIFSHI